MTLSERQIFQEPINTLFSDLRRIFFDAAGGHATFETTAFIIFA